MFFVTSEKIPEGVGFQAYGATHIIWLLTIENGHKHGCWVGICGELGADLTLTETFIKMGIDELSVSPNMVLPIRKVIRETSFN